MEDTGEKCPHCGGNICGHVENVPRHSPLDMPYGPISTENYRLEVGFSCEGCGTKFEFLSGKPEAAEELLRLERKRMANIRW
jgi:hypothetical protein